MGNNTNTTIKAAEDTLLQGIRELISQSMPERSEPGTIPSEQIQTMVEELMADFVATLSIGLPNLKKEVLDFIQSYRPVLIELPEGVVIKVPDAGLISFFVKILDDITVGNNVYLFGEAGTGKTTLAEKVAVALGLQFVTLNCSQFTSPIDIIGGQTIRGYKEGRLIDAWVNGKMLIIDEIPKLDPNTAGLLNDALAKAAQADAVIYSGEGIAYKRHPKFCVIATGNTTGKGTNPRYNGNNKLDLSLIDRFSGSYYEVGFNEDLERALVFPMVMKICLKIRYNLKTLNVEEIMTLRTMLSFNRIYQLEMERETGRRAKSDNGKTLMDSLDSYFAVMNPDKALKMKDAIDYNAFRSEYKDLRSFEKEYKDRFEAKEKK
jgi:MoxR-like ATPase